MSEFYQEGPRLTNTFDSDRLLQSLLKRKLEDAAYREVHADLRRFGERLVGDILEMAMQAEAEPPRLVQYDPWGRRVDRIESSAGWSGLDRVAAEEGIVAAGYERRYGPLSRLAQFAKLYLFHPSSAFYSCPLAMTDGAARAIEVHGDSELKERAFKRLTSREPSRFWTSGQWMTERTGGSDVSGTSTVARLENGTYKLYGDKWFTSATTSQMAMTLARIEGAPAGSKGLSFFYLELRDEQKNLRGIRVNRLKDKLGTKALPTAELTLDGTPARLIGGEGGGVRKISTLFNVTRLYNACCAVGGMRRAISLARDYSVRRAAFGKRLSEHALHLETLAAMQVEFEGAFHLTMHAAELLGKEETGQASEEESATLRGLMPVVKLYTAKQSVAVMSETLEAFGGAGYCEDTGIPRLLRDTQVLAIWEGTTNVLSLDLLRAIDKDRAFEAMVASSVLRLSRIEHSALVPARQQAEAALKEMQLFFAQLSDLDSLQSAARTLAFMVAKVFSAALLLEHAQWEVKNGQAASALVPAIRWCSTLEGLTADRLRRAGAGVYVSSGFGFSENACHLSRYLALDR